MIYILDSYRAVFAVNFLLEPCSEKNLSLDNA